MNSGNRMDGRIVTVFGGTGFLGGRIVKRLLAKGFYVRAASRHPRRAARLFASDEKAAPEAVEADILDASSVARAMAGSHAVVNAVSLYVESGNLTFERLHVQAAAELAQAAHKIGVEQLIHVSGIGSDPLSNSSYIRARGRGEDAVWRAFPGSAIVRPAVMMGPDDAFLTTLIGLIRRFRYSVVATHSSSRFTWTKLPKPSAG